jgi:hypothetical protein
MDYLALPSFEDGNGTAAAKLWSFLAAVPKSPRW